MKKIGTFGTGAAKKSRKNFPAVKIPATSVPAGTPWHPGSGMNLGGYGALHTCRLPQALVFGGMVPAAGTAFGTGAGKLAFRGGFSFLHMPCPVVPLVCLRACVADMLLSTSSRYVRNTVCAASPFFRNVGNLIFYILKMTFWNFIFFMDVKS